MLPQLTATDLHSQMTLCSIVDSNEWYMSAKQHLRQRLLDDACNSHVCRVGFPIRLAKQKNIPHFKLQLNKDKVPQAVLRWTGPGWSAYVPAMRTQPWDNAQTFKHDTMTWPAWLASAKRQNHEHQLGSAAAGAVGGVAGAAAGAALKVHVATTVSITAWRISGCTFSIGLITPFLKLRLWHCRFPGCNKHSTAHNHTN